MVIPTWPSEEVLEIARFFDPCMNMCTEYEDAWVFRNTNKPVSECNPIVIFKDSKEPVPTYVYKQTMLLGEYEIYNTDNGKKYAIEPWYVRSLRKRLGLTQAAVAKEAGCTIEVIMSAEDGTLRGKENIQMVKRWVRKAEQRKDQFLY